MNYSRLDSCNLVKGSKQRAHFLSFRFWKFSEKYIWHVFVYIRAQIFSLLLSLFSNVWVCVCIKTKQVKFPHRFRRTRTLYYNTAFRCSACDVSSCRPPPYIFRMWFTRRWRQWRKAFPATQSTYTKGSYTRRIYGI